MESHYKVNDILVSKTTDPFGNRSLIISKLFSDYEEIISNEDSEARTALREVMNYENGYESKAIKL